MKKSIFLTPIVAMLALSCSKDDKGPTGLVIDGNTFTITDAKAVDNYHFDSTTHAQYEFILADGEITVDAAPADHVDFETTGATISIDLNMASAGDTFENGTFNFHDDNADEPAGSYFDSCQIYVDANNNGVIDIGSDTYLHATGGTVKVSGTAEARVLKFHIKLSNGDELNFTYNGGFDYINNRND